MRNVMIMATIMGKQRASDAFTAKGSQPRRLSSPASAVSTLGCLAHRRINDERRMVYKADGDCLLIAQLRYQY